MTRPLFSLFQSHLDLAHFYWNKLLKKGSIVIDATCGNGHDSLVLANLALTHNEGVLFCLDIQKKALDQTKILLNERLSPTLINQIHFLNQSHEIFPPSIPPCDLIVYNLGYLPGGDKGITTLETPTLTSVKNGLNLLKPGGLISITCYPGHPEGAKEESCLVHYTTSLSPKDYLICHHKLLNRPLAPSLLLICKKN